jgi:hemerythrin
MDDQHGILMDTLNELRVQVSRGCTREQVTEPLTRLLEFTGMHFDCEEGLLQRHGYPGLEEHRSAHQRLMSEIRQAVERADHNEMRELQRVLGFLRGWYFEHVERLDRQYGEWLNARGVY